MYVYCNANRNYCAFNNALALLFMFTARSFQSKKMLFFFYRIYIGVTTTILNEKYYVIAIRNLSNYSYLLKSFFF